MTAEDWIHKGADLLWIFMIKTQMNKVLICELVKRGNTEYGNSHSDFCHRDENSLSVQSFRRASVILNLSELPCPGGFPETFKLSVVPRPWSKIVSITVKLFLKGFKTKVAHLAWSINWRSCWSLGAESTWRWGGRWHCGCWREWTSRWTFWPLQAAGGGCTQRVWLIPLRSPYCSSLRTSAKQIESLLETNSFHMLLQLRRNALWLVMELFVDPQIL